MTLGFLSGSKNFCKLLSVYWEVFVLHGSDWIHWVAKSCTTTAYRWLFRDSQPGYVSWNTQPNCRASFNIATALLPTSFFGFLFGCSSTFGCGNEHSAPNLHPDFVLLNWHSGGCQYSHGDWVQVPFKKKLKKRSIEFLRLASASSRHTSASCVWRWWLREWFGFQCRFRTIVALIPATTLVFLRRLPFISPLVTKYLFLFQHRWFLTTFAHVFYISNTVLSSEFVQTFQEVIRWDLGHRQ